MEFVVMSTDTFESFDKNNPEMGIEKTDASKDGAALLGQHS